MNAEILINELKKIIELADKMQSAKIEGVEDGEYHSIMDDFIARIVLDSLIVKTFERSCKNYFDNPHNTETGKRDFLASYYQLTTRQYISYSLIDGECYANYPEMNICEEIFRSPLLQTTQGAIISIETIRRHNAELNDILTSISNKLLDYNDDITPNVKYIMEYLSMTLARIYNSGLLSILERIYLDEKSLLRFDELKKIDEAKRAKEYTFNSLGDYLPADLLRLFADDIYSLVLTGRCPDHICKINTKSIRRDVLRGFIYNIYDSFKGDKSWRKECAQLIITAFNIPNVSSIEESDTYKKMSEKSPAIPRKNI